MSFALLVADTDHGRLLAVEPTGAASVLVGPTETADNEPGALPTAERERRAEVLRAASPSERPNHFRALTDDLDLDEADRALRYETLGDDPVAAFEALLKRARRRGTE